MAASRFARRALSARCCPGDLDARARRPHPALTRVGPSVAPGVAAPAAEVGGSPNTSCRGAPPPSSPEKGLAALPEESRAQGRERHGRRPRCSSGEAGETGGKGEGGVGGSGLGLVERGGA